MHRDRTALLGIIPMCGQAILTNEVADARRDQLQDICKGAIDGNALAGGLLGVARCVFDDSGDCGFECCCGLRHRFSPISGQPLLPFALETGVAEKS